MRFGLRRQLLAIGLVTLSLPLASALYIRETERALRDAQAGFLADIARGLAPLLPRVPALAPPGPADEALYAHPLPIEPVLDGFSDDWRIDAPPADAVVGGGALRVRVGARDGTIWIAAEARHGDAELPAFDVACGRDDAQGLSLINVAPVAPGALQAAVTASEFGGRVRGAWQPVDGGSRIELRLPAGLCRHRLGVAVRTTRGEARTYRGSLPGALVGVDPALRDALRANAIPGIESVVVDRFGLRLTPVTGSRRQASAARRDGATTRLFERLLAEPFAIDDHRLAVDAVTAALSGASVTARRARPDGGTALIATRPLGGGALVLAQDAEAILTLANPSLQRLTTTIVVTTAAVVVLLLAYASWLSWRVRRLARRAAGAVDARGQITGALPETGAGDEIGDLARDMRAMLERTAEQQRWLASMADTLSHELRTPLAVVRSSLDNLEQDALSPSQRRLTARAADGVDRLRAILNAVSGANRAEQAARDAEAAPVALAPLVEQLRDAYAATFPSHVFAADIAAAPVIAGTAELLVQALDKLVENAVRFAPAGSTISLELEADADDARIAVRNVGPPLPAGDTARLFESFVSGDEGGGVHLGFGLYIARLIVEAHGGAIAATDWHRAGASGVVVTCRLPRSPG